MKDHARNIISDSGVNLVTAYRLPDNLFADAQITIDIVFLKKAETGIKWLETKNITIGNVSKPINEYFMKHPDNIVGELQVVPMYNRTGLTCKPSGDLKEKLRKIFLEFKAR